MAFSKDFDPSKGSSVYTMQNLDSGDSFKLRVMTEIINGWSLWTEEDGKAQLIRAEEKEQIDPKNASINPHTGKKNKPKEFIACIVYNYETEQFEVFETDKSSIYTPLYDFEHDGDLGDLREYDIKLSKTGQGKETRYSVLPLGKSKVKKEIQEQFNELEYNLHALYDGENPMEVTATDSDDEVDF